MKAKDLLQAMNDIDPKLLEGTEPWGEPAQKKPRRPVWAVAVAAGLVLCVALGAGVMMANHGPQTASSEAGTLTAMPLPGAQELSAADLEFAVNDTRKMQETGVLYEEGVTHRSLTLDELDYLRNQPGLSWMQDYYLLGNGLMDAQGNVILLQVMGYAPAVVEADPELFPMNQAPVFLLELAPGQNGTDVEDLLEFLSEPNNQVEGVGVRAGRIPLEDTAINGVTGSTKPITAQLYCTQYTLENLQVGMIAVSSTDDNGSTAEEAEKLAETAVGWGISQPMEIDQISAEPLGNDTPNLSYGDSYHLIMLGPQGAPAPLEFAPYTVETQENYGSYEEFLEAIRSDFPKAIATGDIPEGTTSEELTKEELASIWGGKVPWDENIPIEGWANYDKDGHLEEIYIYGGTDQENQAIGSEFLVTLKLGSLDWDAICAKELSYDIITEPNNTVAGQNVYAVTTTIEESYVDPETDETVDAGDLTSYKASFQVESPSQVAVSVYGYARGSASEDPTPEEIQAEALAQEEAQALVESVVGHSLYYWISLGHLYMQGTETASSQTEESQESSSLQAASSQPETLEQPSVFQEESPLDLSFTVRPNEDETFSNVWNTFTTLYLEPQNLAAHGAEPDYELSEEELRSIWGGELPWEGMLTENDTVTAYGYFSEDGELIKVYVGGHRDNPQSPTTEAYQLFSVSLYNMELTGQWGQDAKEMLALADSQFQGVDIATQQIASTQDYDDGSSMDFTVYSAGFVPSAGPTLMVVDGFHSPVAFTQGEAQSFVNLVTEASLLNGVTLGNVDD